ncbi:MAG: transposase [Desulfovibrio sp.]|nr:transposase [Desulfovibrio sp.]
MSQEAIQNTADRVKAAILPYYEAIGDSVRKSWYAHIDETSWCTHDPMLGKSLHRLRTMTNHVLAYFRIDPHRSEYAFSDTLRYYWQSM